ncbi:Ankyrin repeat-containing protein [Carex littledalei]|uniref:Ankyrin repeat-containing protein n=1 Tax=Carex littledalei TaxID=544730 RepID=A0A833W223_9POAL|nr:Ankyrin repeat-containing protein [Carex littledalei]
MASNSRRISLDRRLYDAAKNGDMVLLKQVLYPRPRQVDEKAEARCLLLGVTHGGDTALHIAARFGHLEVATEICSNINVFLLMKDNDKSETPLHYAAKAGKCDLVTYFIDLANSIIELGDMLRKRNRDGETALYQAILYKHSDVVEMFQNVSENHVFSQLVSIPNNENISPLYLAIMHGQHDIVTSLIGSLREVEDVPPEAYAGPAGQTALHAAALHKKPEGFVQEVLDWKEELAKSTDKSGSTALHYAASSGNLEAVSAILQTDITCAYMADSSGLYPVHIAVKTGFLQVMAKLFDLCPDLDQLLDNNGRNFVHLAVEEERDDIVRSICRTTELTEAMNAQDNNGDTAMHLAVKAGHLNIFARLLGTQKAHLCVTNKNGLTPRDLALSNLKGGFTNWQNPDRTMFRILNRIRHCRGINRRDHFASEFSLQYAQKKEKMVEGIESMAKTNAIGAVLIASAAFAGAFSVSAAYKADILAGHESASLNFTFKCFILMVVCAFVCSIVATSIIMQSALTFLAPIYREKYILMSSELIKMATMGFVASFAIGVYIVLSPVSKWLAYLVCISLAVVPVLVDPHLWPNYLLIKALIKYLGWKGLLFGCYSLRFFKA